MISFKEFERLAQNYNVIPLVKHLLSDVMTPVSAYLSLREAGVPSFLFESVEPNEKIGRYSFVGIAPTLLITAKGKKLTIREGAKTKECEGSIFDAIQKYSSQYHAASLENVQCLTGGFVGYIGYGCVRSLEEIPPCRIPSDAPDSMMGLFTTIIQFDHAHQLSAIIHNTIVDPETSIQLQYMNAVKAIESIELRLKRPPIVTHTFAGSLEQAHENVSEPEFVDMVVKAKKHILEGDIFQVVLSRLVSVPYVGDPFSVYRALRVINPSPYLFYIDFGDIRLIGSSPEVLVKVQSNVVTVLPIAGTRPRGKTRDEDNVLEKELLNDTKELAEHVMLVDLGRNDVGSVSKPGSVSVPVYARVERFSHVMHIVSEVRGELTPDKTGIDALKRCFPAGTVSGAPKVRAMEIISELEERERGVYAGAVGYIGFNGSVDTCIAIRTIVAREGELVIQAGAGIVADSIPEAEFRETQNKARALLEAIRFASTGLSLSENNAIPEPRS